MINKAASYTRRLDWNHTGGPNVFPSGQIRCGISRRERLTKRSLLITIMLLAFAAAFVAACGPQPALAEFPNLTDAPQPIGYPPSTTTGTATPGVLSQGGPVEDDVDLADRLHAAGAAAEPAGEIEQAFFSVKGQVIRVNGADVQVFEYEDASAAETDAALVAPDGGSVGTIMVMWVDAPHFYKAGRLIVLYVGADSDLADLLESAVGSQFVGR